MHSRPRRRVIGKSFFVYTDESENLKKIAAARGITQKALMHQMVEKTISDAISSGEIESDNHDMAKSLTH